MRNFEYLNVALLSLLFLTSCAPTYVAPVGFDLARVTFNFASTDSRNAISVFDEHETCKGKKVILDNKKQNTVSTAFEKTELKSFDVYSVFDQVYTGISFQSSVCRYMFSLPLQAAEYEVILSSSESGCDLAVNEVANGQKKVVDVEIKENISNPDTFSSSSHCK